MSSLGTTVSQQIDELAVSDRTAGKEAQPPIHCSAIFEDSGNRFVQENSRRIFQLVYKLVRNVDDAHDLTQEIFTKVLGRQTQLRDSEKASNWLSRIATNTAIDFIRRRKKNVFEGSYRLAELPSSQYESAEQSLLRREYRIYIERGLARLTTRQRAALILRDVENEPPRQVAARMNCSIPTVRSHIAKARAKFRQYLQEDKVL